MSEIKVIFSKDFGEDLEDLIRSKVGDTLRQRFNTPHAGEFIMANEDRVDTSSAVDKLIKRLEESNYIHKNNSGDYVVSDNLVDEYLYGDLSELDSEEVDEIDYFDTRRVPEIDEIINEIVDEAYEALDMNSEYSKAYNRYVRREIYDNDDDDYEDYDYDDAYDDYNSED